MKTRRVAVVAGVLGVLGLAACSSNPDTYDRDQVWVSSDYPSSNAVADRIQNTLQRNDGIVVSVETDGSNSLTPNTLNISASGDGPGGITVAADDHWLDQRVADRMVAALDAKDTRVDRVVTLIDEIHDWQHAHPRPAPPPPPPPAPPFNWVRGALMPVGGELLLLGGIWGSWRGFRWLRVRVRAHLEMRRQLAERADRENADYLQGDPDAIFGQHRPSSYDRG